MYIISQSETISRIYQSLENTKDLLVSSLIYGEAHVGKKSMVSKLYKESIWVSGENLKDIQKALNESSYVVITNFEKVTDLDFLDFENSNIVAICNSKTISSRLEDKFAFIYHIPSLREREDDVKLFSKEYIEEAKKIYNIDKEVEIDSFDIDISENLKSLKSSIYKSVLLKNLDKSDIYKILYNYFYNNYEGSNIYKEHLEIFEKALLSAGLDIYKSQLKLSDVLGINRNTLRKKINEQLWNRL